MSNLQQLTTKMIILRANLLFHSLTRRSYATEAVFKTQPYRLHRLEQGPAAEITLTRKESLVLYERMATMRKMEAAANVLYKSKVIRGFCHLYAGQEAVAVGTFAHLRPKKDIISTTYRSHGWAYLSNNVTPTCIIAELVGVKSGCVRGKGGSMHLYNRMLYGGNAIVGAQVPLGVGIALAHKYRESDAVSLTVFGDGASNNGQVFEAYNMAKLWNLPCIFLCENNLYSMGTSVSRHSSNPDIYTKGDFVPGIQLDGMDVITVWEAARFAMNHIKTGNGPILLEAQTYRYSGHSLSDPGTTYRSRGEVQDMREKKDPISGFKHSILEAKLVNESELKAIDSKVKGYIDLAVKKAKQDKPVNVQELTHDIYADELISEVRGVAPYHVWKHKYSGWAFNKK